MLFQVRQHYKNTDQSVFDLDRLSLVDGAIGEHQHTGIQRAGFTVGQDNRVTSRDDVRIGGKAALYEMFQRQ